MHQFTPILKQVVDEEASTLYTIFPNSKEIGSMSLLRPFRAKGRSEAECLESNTGQTNDEAR